MSNKIENPVVLIHKRESHDSYAVAITNGSHDFYDGLPMASVSPDEADNSFAVFAMVGYYMAAEIEKLRAQRDALAAENAALKESERAFDAMCAEEHGDKSDDGYFKIGRTFADEHYEKSRVTVVDDSDPDVIALLDELDKRQQHIRRLEQENVEMALTLEKLRVELETVKQREKDLFMENVRLKSGIAGLIHLGIRYANVEVMKIAGDAQLSTPCTDSIINSIASGVFTKEGQHYENSRSSR